MKGWLFHSIKTFEYFWQLVFFLRAAISSADEVQPSSVHSESRSSHHEVGPIASRLAADSLSRSAPRPNPLRQPRAPCAHAGATLPTSARLNVQTELQLPSVASSLRRHNRFDQLGLAH
eukprot:6205972-Pleurochrysis_carterae.AAC.3